MSPTFLSLRRVACAMLALLVLVAAGCGQITDKDRIRIAKIGDKYITRGNLFKLIREMPDTERPMIRNRSDLLRVLNQHIDSQIKLPLGRKLAGEGKIEVSRDLAREQFFRDSGEDEEVLRHSWNIEIPPPGVVTPLMQVYGLTPELLQFNKDNVEEGTDRTMAKMLGEKAVEYLALEALKEGRITLDQAEIEREYRFMKDQLVRYEEISFIGVRFPAQMENAATLAAQARERLDAGAAFDDILREYRERERQEKVSYIVHSDIQNNPALEKFRGFWSAASGAREGDIIGPVYLPAYQQIAEDKDGRAVVMQMPDAYLIFRVLEHRPERALSLEEAQPLVALPLLKAKMMRLLREEKGVEVYEDKLPDPSHVQGPTAI